MPSKRILRVTEAIKRELGFILDRKLEDPRIGMVTVTRVELSDDLKYAKVYVSFLGDDEEKASAMQLLRRARRFVRGELAHSLRLKTVPELSFLLDDSSERYLRIAEVLKKIREEDSDRVSGESEQEGGQPGEDPRGS